MSHDSLVVRQGGDVERLRGSWDEGEGVSLLLSQHGRPMRLIDVQAQRVGETMGHNKGQVLQPLQFTLLLVANLQADGVIPFLQLQRVLVGVEDRQAIGRAHV